jgi:hypothetical protein
VLAWRRGLGAPGCVGSGSALHINGGGLPSREDAERDSLAAIRFALEGNPADYDPTAEALTLDVTVAPAA